MFFLDYEWWGEEAEDIPQDGNDSDGADVRSIESFDDISLAGILGYSDSDQINLGICNLKSLLTLSLFCRKNTKTAMNDLPEIR